MICPSRSIRNLVWRSRTPPSATGTILEALRLPQDAKTFIAGVQQEMREALETFDRGLPENPHVKILDKSNGWIALSPLDAQPEPVSLVALKAELSQRWPMTGSGWASSGD